MTFDLVVRELQHRSAIHQKPSCRDTLMAHAEGDLLTMQVIVNSLGGSVFAAAAAMQVGGVTQLQGISPAALLGGFLASLICSMVLPSSCADVERVTSMLQVSCRDTMHVAALTHGHLKLECSAKTSQGL